VWNALSQRQTLVALAAAQGTSFSAPVAASISTPFAIATDSGIIAPIAVISASTANEGGGAEALSIGMRNLVYQNAKSVSDS
jgi:hypothetical protein